jgi:hypothetical protein
MKHGPGIAELARFKTLGIATFDPVLPGNEHALRKNDGDFYEPVDVEGVASSVAILCKAPEAASRFAVTPAVLAKMCRQVCVKEIGETHAFEYTLGRGLRIDRILGSTPGGEAIAPGYSEVKEIAEPFGSWGSAEGSRIRALGSRHGVAGLLVLEPSVYAEVGRVVEQAAQSSFGREITVGNFVLRTAVSYRYALFDARTGSCVTTSDRTPPAYDTSARPEDLVIDLGPSAARLILDFMATREYASLFAQPLREALKPYLSLFRACVIATR